MRGVLFGGQLVVYSHPKAFDHGWWDDGVVVEGDAHWLLVSLLCCRLEGEVDEH